MAIHLHNFASKKVVLVQHNGSKHNLISKKEVTITIVPVNYSRNKAQLIDHYYNKEAINLGLAHGDAGASHKTRVAGSTTAYLPQFHMNVIAIQYTLLLVSSIS